MRLAMGFAPNSSMNMQSAVMAEAISSGKCPAIAIWFNQSGGFLY